MSTHCAALRCPGGNDCAGASTVRSNGKVAVYNKAAARMVITLDTNKPTDTIRESAVASASSGSSKR